MKSYSENFLDFLAFHSVETQTLIALFVAIVIAIVIGVLVSRKAKKKGQQTGTPKAVKPRFRKRDMVRFYGRKIFRKVQEFKDEVLFEPDGHQLHRRSSFGGRKRLGFPPFAQRFLHRPKHETKRRKKEPPASLLEADSYEIQGGEPQLPAEVMYMLKSVRVFGNFEKPLFFELCKHIESKSLPAGTLLFKPGQMDDCIYIVQSGQLNLYLIDKAGTECFLKKVNAGDNIHSVLHILEAIKGTGDFSFSLLARATMTSQVLKLPSKAFHKVFEDHPESLVRIVQIIMLRLHQVTFQALHRFLGLTSELISFTSHRRRSVELKNLSVYSLKSPTKTSSTSVNRLPDPSISAASRKIPVSPIKEQEEPEDPKTDKPIRRTVSFTNSVSVFKSSELGNKAEAETQPLVIRRTKSSGRLSQEIARRSGSDIYGVSPSDFEVALGRAGLGGLDTPPGGFSVGSDPESSPTSDSEGKFMSQMSTSSSRKEELGPLFQPVDPDEEEIFLEAATKDLCHILGLQDIALLEEKMTIACVPAGTALVKQGDKDCSFYFLVKGSLKVCQRVDDSDEEQVLFTCIPGELVGSLALLTGEPSLFTIRADEPCYMVFISKHDIYSLMRSKPRIVLPVAQGLIKRLSSFVRNIDFALDWIMVEAGKPLYRQSDIADNVYIVLNGRLRSVYTHEDGKKEIVDESGRGELVGLVEVVTQSPRIKAVHAVRDTELAMISDGLLNTIKLKYPQVVTRLIHLLGERILGTFKKSQLPKVSNSNLEKISTNLGTVAVIPASSKVPLHNFTFELSLALTDIGPTLLLTSDLIKKRLGKSALDSVHEYYLSTWLGQQEDIHRIVVYQADNYMSEWTRRCIRQADAILIVGLGDEEPTVGQLEAQLESASSVRAQKDLILLYPEEKFEQPTNNVINNTVDWLNERGWISAHHHVRCPKKIFKHRLLSDRYEQDPNYEPPSRNSDFARLARRLTGTSIGLVLGGGGARGCAHVGIIKALSEAGIPIDMIGGTSMGAFIGAIFAEDADVVKLVQRARENSRKMASIAKKLLDITYPITSLFSGKQFNGEISQVFGDRCIEDMLLPYFCVSTDITSSRMKVHQTGSLWRYVRASMSLAGYLPPLCDPVDGHLLLDGGYVNNLPADVMKSLGAQTIIAVDVGSEYTADLTNYGDSVSGWWLLWNRWNPFAKPVKIPDMQEIQTRLAYVSCVQQLEEVKNSSYCHYLRPPVDKYQTLQFGSFEEIMNAGYHHGKGVFQSLLKGNALPEMLCEPEVKRKQADATATSPSFTDLAELVSRIEPPKSNTFSKWVQAAESASNLLITDPYNSDNEADDDHDLLLARRIRNRSGSLTDVDLMPESDLPSGSEEAGYESEDLSKLRKMRKNVPLYLRTHSNAV